MERLLSESDDQTTVGPRVVNPAKNRRATVRYQCAPATSAKVYAAEDITFQVAWIMDLSKTGAGLLLKQIIAGRAASAGELAKQRRRSHRRNVCASSAELSSSNR